MVFIIDLLMLTTFAKDLKAWKVKQRAHYKAHPHGDPQHTSVWKEILENWDRAVAGSTEDLTSRSAAGLMMAVRDAFTKSVSVVFMQS